MGVIDSGHNSGSGFTTNEQVTAANLNSHVNDSTFDSTAVDDNTIEIYNSSGTIRLKDSSSKTTGTTFAKMQHISTAKVLGRTTAGEGDVEEVSLLDEDDMSSDSATAVATQQSIKAYVNSQAIGVGQTWQNVASSRSNNTAFQNTTGRPIQVCISFTSDGSTTLNVQVSSDNSTYITLATIGHDPSESATSFIVPNNHYYKTVGSLTIRTWVELR